MQVLRTSSPRIREPQNSWEISYVLMVAGRYRGDDATLRDVVRVIEDYRRKELKAWMATGFTRQWQNEHRGRRR